MTVEEFTAATFEVARTRELQPHERADLTILRRTVQKHGNVAPIEELLLSWAGRPWSGKVWKPKPKITKVKAVQQELF